jgi:hypothetical protein
MMNLNTGCRPQGSPPLGQITPASGVNYSGDAGYRDTLDCFKTKRPDKFQIESVRALIFTCRLKPIQPRK